MLDTSPKALLLVVALVLSACRKPNQATSQVMGASSGVAPNVPAIAEKVGNGGAGSNNNTEGNGGAGSNAGARATSPDPAELPQTNDKPQLNSEHFKKLGPALFAAIVNDNPDPALPYFFPKAAYAQVKAIKDPAVDWERRLVAAFRRDIHEYHRGLKSGSGPSFLSLEISQPNTRWMKRGEEGNRIGYFRTVRASLRYQETSGRERFWLVSSMISWRGEWYVVHLNGFH